MTVLVEAVGLGPPLHTMSLEVTSLMGPSYVGTRTPSPTLPLLTERKIVWAEDAVAKRRGVVNFMVADLVLFVGGEEGGEVD